MFGYLFFARDIEESSQPADSHRNREDDHAADRALHIRHVLSVVLKCHYSSDSVDAGSREIHNTCDEKDGGSDRQDVCPCRCALKAYDDRDDHAGDCRDDASYDCSVDAER